MEEHAHDFDSLTDNHFNEMQKKVGIFHNSETSGKSYRRKTYQKT